MSPTPERFQFSLKAAIVMMLLSGVALGVVIGVVSFFRNIERAEFNLHAMCYTIDVVDEHIKERGGDWPRSWEEFEKIAAASSNTRRYTVDYLKRRLTIDFNARLEDLATQTGQTFKAIRPIGPCYMYDEWTNRLLETIRTRLSQPGETAKSANRAQ